MARSSLEVARLLVNGGADILPTSQGCLEFEFLRRTDRAIEGDPRHDLRVREMSATAANFPQTVIRLGPDLLEMRDERAFETELHRLRAELTIATTGDAAEAEKHFLRAIELARRRGARGYELRAASGLCVLWRGVGRAGN